MSNQETNTQFLRNYLEELRKAYGYHGLAFELPENKLNIAMKIIAEFDSLDSDLRIKIARRFGTSPDGYKKLLFQAENIFYDPKYANVSQGEKSFYITVDILFKDIFNAAAELGLEAKTDIVFGLLPVRQTNAEARKVDNRGYIILINTGTFIFLQSMGIIFSRFTDNFLKVIDVAEVEINESILERWVLESANEKINDLFVDVLVSYAYSTYQNIGIPTLSRTYYSRDDANEDISGHVTTFEDLMLEFILCHEYIHTCSLVDEPLQFETEKEKMNWYWSSEFSADVLGLYLSFRAKDHRQANGLVPGMDIYTISKSFLGAYCLMSCLEVLDRCSSLLCQKGWITNYPQQSPTHPPTHARKDHLVSSLTRLLSRIGLPQGGLDMALYPAKAYEILINTLWETNKTRAITAILTAEVSFPPDFAEDN
jgi:hypothetical protein